MLTGHLFEVGMVFDVVIPEGPFVRTTGERRTEIGREIICIGLQHRTVIRRVDVEKEADGRRLSASNSPVAHPQAEDAGVGPGNLQVGDVVISRESYSKSIITPRVHNTDERQNVGLTVVPRVCRVGDRFECRIGVDIHDAVLARCKNPRPGKDHRKLELDLVPGPFSIPCKRHFPDGLVVRNLQAMR